MPKHCATSELQKSKKCKHLRDKMCKKARSYLWDPGMGWDHHHTISQTAPTPRENIIKSDPFH